MNDSLARLLAARQITTDADRADDRLTVERRDRTARTWKPETPQDALTAIVRARSGRPDVECRLIVQRLLEEHGELPDTPAGHARFLAALLDAADLALTTGDG